MCVCVGGGGGGQTSWTQIGLLQKEQSDLGLHCLSMRIRNISADEENRQHFCCDRCFKGKLRQCMMYF